MQNLKAKGMEVEWYSNRITFIPHNVTYALACRGYLGPNTSVPDLNRRN